ncbi:MAG TPA: hypothetical protein VN601_01790, partial [Arthrobacter sp.]|nr:hypothetical protein [Arthrobacter sp.]
MTGPRSLLILSLSPLRSDPRVLKQITLFRDKYRVFTCGFGPAPDGVAGHFELDTALASWPRDPQRLALRRYPDVYWNIAAVAQARKLLRGQQFDAVLANDTNTVPLALSLEPQHGVKLLAAQQLARLRHGGNVPVHVGVATQCQPLRIARPTGQPGVQFNVSGDAVRRRAEPAREDQVLVAEQSDLLEHPRVAAQRREREDQQGAGSGQRGCLPSVLSGAGTP